MQLLRRSPSVRFVNLMVAGIASASALLATAVGCGSSGESGSDAGMGSDAAAQPESGVQDASNGDGDAAALPSDANAGADAHGGRPDGGGQDAAAWSPPPLARGVTLSNFTGAVYGVETKYNSLLGMGWNRAPQQLTWSQVEPSKGTYDWKAGDDLVTANHANGVEVLPLLAGVPGWAQSACDAGAGNCGWYPPANPSDWTDFVTAFVSHYVAPPFDLRYFEIWNEPGQYGNFWPLDYQSFVDDIFNPAAQIVRQHGGLVVFGGYPCDECGQPWTVDAMDAFSFDTMLSYHGAWQNTDVLNIHYDPLKDWKSLYGTWVATGKITGGIWQTEVGWDDNPSRYTAFYLQSLTWALSAGNWAQNAQRYKLMWYAGEGPDPKDLVDVGAGALTPTGVQLSTMNSALGGGELSVFTAFDSDIQNPAPGFRVTLLAGLVVPPTFVQ